MEAILAIDMLPGRNRAFFLCMTHCILIEKHVPPYSMRTCAVVLINNNNNIVHTQTDHAEKL